MWITELGWWSNGPYNFLAQADITARAQLWMRALGIPVWEQLMVQGTYGDGDLTYSLIQGDSLVKPAALAAMVEATQTRGRAFNGWLASGLPLTYAASFGARAGGGGTVVALWTDDVALRVRVRLIAGSARQRDARRSIRARRGASRYRGSCRLSSAARSSTSSCRRGTGWRLVRPSRSVATSRLRAPARARPRARARNPMPLRSRSTAISVPRNVGELSQSPAWASAAGDGAPTLTVRLAHAARIDRVLLATVCARRRDRPACGAGP